MRGNSSSVLSPVRVLKLSYEKNTAKAIGRQLHVLATGAGSYAQPRACLAGGRVCMLFIPDAARMQSTLISVSLTILHK